MDESHAIRTSPHAILETVVYCGDLEAARRFYQHVIGLSLVSVEHQRHLFFRIGESMFLVFNPEATLRSTTRIDSVMIPNHGATGPGHVAFRVERDQMEAMLQQLGQHQIAIESDIEWPGGGRSIYCRDPAGNSVEFATRELWFS